MYAKFFGLKHAPFSIAPDPRYLFMSERHREALAHLLYGLQGGGGFVLLTGEIGAGKTTVCRCVLEQLPQHCQVAYIFNPKLNVLELLQTVCEEYRIALPPPDAAPGSLKPYVDRINAFLLQSHAQGRNNVLIIDEAQNLSPEVLEQLRLLTNLETQERKLLQIILVGQPELREMLAQPELEQLAQRVIARFHLGPLSEDETWHYVRHRLGVAGFSGTLPFDRGARRRVQQLSRGVPRRINLLCDRALLGAYAQGRSTVNRATVEQAAREVFGGRDGSARKASQQALAWGTAGLGLLFAASTLVWSLQQRRGADVAVPAANARMAAAPASTSSGGGAKVPGLAVAASAAAPTPVVPDLASGITLALRSEQDAWRELAAAWQLPDGGEEPCAAWKQQQVQCFRGEGGLALLRLLNRPSLLLLQDGSGKPVYVQLVKLDAQQATVQAGDRRETVSLASLQRQWRGEFATLWRVPPGYQSVIAPGYTGPMIDWLDAQLGKLFGEPAARRVHRYDAALQARVAAFQRTQGLRSDGRVGPVTLMQLNRVAGIAEPRMQADAAAP